jgi:gamma-glutamylcyclotransferase (GGCT)/AIG2-like uncharacterized protein YtfP
MTCEAAGMALFAYGTLMFPAVIHSVIGRIPRAEPAVVKGYRRLAVRGEKFPGLVRDGQEAVPGLLYQDLSADEWKRLNAFEDEFYDLREVCAHCSAGAIAALAYLVPPSRRSVLSEKPWNPHRFEEFLLSDSTGQDSCPLP